MLGYFKKSHHPKEWNVPRLGQLEAAKQPYAAKYDIEEVRNFYV